MLAPPNKLLRQHACSVLRVRMAYIVGVWSGHSNSVALDNNNLLIVIERITMSFRCFWFSRLANVGLEFLKINCLVDLLVFIAPLALRADFLPALAR